MVKVEFTGSVEEVKKEIREFIEVSSIGVTTEGLATSIKENLEAETKVEKKSTVKVEEKKEPTKTVEETPAAKLPTAPTKQEVTPAEVPTPLPTKTAEYTATDLQKIAAAWVNKDIDNNRAALKNLLSTFGVKAISFLPKENYGTFVQELKNLGADV